MLGRKLELSGGGALAAMTLGCTLAQLWKEDHSDLLLPVAKGMARAWMVAQPVRLIGKIEVLLVIMDQKCVENK